MRSISRLLVALSLATSGLTLAAQQPSGADALFQRGLLLERAEGNLTQAVVLYERVVAEYPKDAVVVPQALFHLARVYEKTDAHRATRMWARLASEYGATTYADEARRKLAFAQAQAAGPFAMRSLDTALGTSADDLGGFDLSPDAKSAAYVRTGDAGDKLFIRDIDSGKDRQMVSESRGLKLQPWSVWSPDGRRLAFLVFDKRTVGSAAGFPPTGLALVDVRIVTVGTGQVREVAKTLPGFVRYDWSPDGQRVWVLFGRTQNAMETFGGTAQIATETLQIITVASGESKQVTGRAIVGVAWSPDSKEVAFKSANDQHADEFRILSADTGQVRTLPIPFTGPGAVSLDAGSPRDRARAWATPDRIQVMQTDPAGRSSYLISPNGGLAKRTCVSSSERQCGVLTPDGVVQVALDKDRLMLLDLVRGGERRASGAFGDERAPMLSPDGRLLAYLSNPDGRWALFVVPIDKTPVTMPVRLAVFNERPDSALAVRWSQDGRLVVDLSYSDDNVYRINVDKSGRATGPAGRLTQDSGYTLKPFASPDSTRIAYSYNNGGKRGVAVMTADGAGEHPVSEGTLGPLGWLSVDEVLFRKPAESGRPIAVGAINIKTGGTRTVAEFGATPVLDYQYVRSANEIIYWQGAANMPSPTLRARSMKDGSDRTLVTIDAPSGFVGFRVSPDGRQIAYGRILPGDARRPEMRVMTIDGRDDRLLLTSPSTGGWRSAGYPYDWSPDGRFLLYDEAPGALRVVDVGTGQSWAIAEAADTNNQTWGNAQWAPDGSFIAITRQGSRDEYRAFEGVTYDAVVKLMAGKK